MGSPSSSGSGGHLTDCYTFHDARAGTNIQQAFDAFESDEGQSGSRQGGNPGRNKEMEMGVRALMSVYIREASVV